MASVKDLEKLFALPPSSTVDSPEYSVSKGNEIKSVVKASSNFEAAAKFAFWLREFGQISPNETTIIEIGYGGDRFLYSITLDKGKLEIELSHMMKNSSFADNNETDRIIFNGIDDAGYECDFESGELIDDALRQFFGFSSFRPLQKETIVLTMKAKDVMTVVGTGGGKSLTFLLPAVLSCKPTVVVTPVKSLIEDVLSKCCDLGISACKFTGDVQEKVQEEQLSNLESYKIILVTPEVLKDGKLASAVQTLVEEGNMARIVFDEAHTIVNWGNTFRPDYKEVCEKLAKLSGCPKLLLSATVSGKVEEQIKEIFTNLTTLRTSVFRENLELFVTGRTSRFYTDLQKFILEHSEECGIIYCVLPKDVSIVHAELLKRGIECVKYHGQLSEQCKLANYSKWMNGECKLMVANSSFGMGIDKQDVRFVIHARIPTSIEEYYQQCGRAGRDGNPSKCIMYYTYADKNSLLKLFRHQADIAPQMSDVNELINFLEDPVRCRHKCIMMYFGESRSSFSCVNRCDNCCHRGGHHLTDGTTDALKVVQAMVELTGKTVVCNTLKLFLAGSRQKSILEQELDVHSNFGILEKKFVPLILLEKFLHSLIFNGVLAEKVVKKGRHVFLELMLGPKAHDLLALKMSVTRYEK